MATVDTQLIEVENKITLLVLSRIQNSKHTLEKSQKVDGDGMEFIRWFH